MKKKLYIIFILVSFLLTYFVCCPKVIKVSFTSNSSKDIVYQVFYTTKENERFNENHSVKQEVHKTQKEVLISLPADKIYRFRLDFGKNPGKVQVSNLKLKGSTKINLSDFSQFSFNKDIENKTIEDNKLTIITNKKDPYIIYTPPFKLKGKSHWSTFLLINLGIIYLFWLLFYYKSEEEVIKSKMQNIEFLRIVFTFAVVCTHFLKKYLQLYSAGGYGVSFFFILSGYFLATTFKPEVNILNYVKKKFIQFVPLIIFGGLISQGGIKAFQGMFFLQNTGLSYKDIPNAPAWYIGVLFWLSIFYLLVLKVFTDKNKLALFVGSITFIACVIVAQSPGDRWDMIYNYFPRGLFRGIAGMGIGILIAMSVKRDMAVSKNINWKSTVLETVCFGLLIWQIFISNIIPYWFINTALLSGLIILFVKNNGLISRIFDRPIFGYCSKYCLAIYLTHWFNNHGGIITYIQNNHPILLSDYKALVITITLLISVIVGVIAHHFIEKPCAYLLKKLFFDPKVDSK